jgi:hypothetical protein
MSLNPADPVIVGVNAGEPMKRHEQHLGGRLSMQGDRQMTATNVQFDSMKNDATSLTLAAVAEAVEVAHVLETCQAKRTRQRIVIYPSSLSKLETVLVTGNVGLDTEDGNDIAYQPILSACDTFANPPKFFPDDSQDFSGFDIADKVPLWMHTAAQVSIGGRKQVREDGKDVWDSESDSENEAQGEELANMCTSEIPLGKDGRPVGKRYKLSPEQVNAMRADAARRTEESKGSTAQSSAAGFCEPTTQPRPNKRLGRPL